MRYIKLSSDKNPNNDFIELNDLNGFFCTIFQSIGISRKLDYLAIENRRFSVENKTEFKKYNLVVEILSKYSEYEAKHRELITFLDRNKKDGFRLYYRPYDGEELRYCLCDIESSKKAEKLQPIVLTLEQKSLWLGEEKHSSVVYEEQTGNIFAFMDNNDYYSASFSEDNDLSSYYCISFYNGMETKAEITNNCYNEIPLKIMIFGACVNPTVSLFRKGETSPIRTLQVLANVSSGYYIEINADILKNGIWYVNETTGEKTPYDALINNNLGSPYFYIEHGDYYITTASLIDVVCQEEYSG